MIVRLQNVVLGTTRYVQVTRAEWDLMTAAAGMDPHAMTFAAWRVRTGPEYALVRSLWRREFTGPRISRTIFYGREGGISA